MSRHSARPFDLQWARDVIRQCQAAGVPVFLKQLGARPVAPGRWSRTPVWYDIHLRDHKGGDMSEWPEDLRVRQYPESR